MKKLKLLSIMVVVLVVSVTAAKNIYSWNNQKTSYLSRYFYNSKAMKQDFYDKNSYDLKLSKLTDKELDNFISLSLNKKLLDRSISYSNFVTNNDFEEFVKHFLVTFDYGVATVDYYNFANKNYNEDKIIRAYEFAKNDFNAKKYKLEYIELNYQDLLNDMKISDEELLLIYNEHKKNYFDPERLDLTFIQVNKSQLKPNEIIMFEQKMHNINKKLKQCKNSKCVDELVEFINGSKDLNVDNKIEIIRDQVVASAYPKEIQFLQVNHSINVMSNTEYLYMVYLHNRVPFRLKSFEEVKDRIYSKHQQILVNEKIKQLKSTLDKKLKNEKESLYDLAKENNLKYHNLNYILKLNSNNIEKERLKTRLNFYLMRNKKNFTFEDDMNIFFVRSTELNTIDVTYADVRDEVIRHLSSVEHDLNTDFALKNIIPELMQNINNEVVCKKFNMQWVQKEKLLRGDVGVKDVGLDAFVSLSSLSKIGPNGYAFRSPILVKNDGQLLSSVYKINKVEFADLNLIKQDAAKVNYYNGVILGQVNSLEYSTIN